MFCVGLANPRIQRRLLLESELSFEKAVQTAEAIHKVDQETENFHSVPGAEVKKLHSFPTKSNEGKSIFVSIVVERGILPLVVDLVLPSATVVEKLATWQEHVY